MAAHTKRGRRRKKGSVKSNSSSAARAERAVPPKGSTDGMKRALLIASVRIETAQMLKGELNDRKIDLINTDFEAAMTLADIARGAPEGSEKGLRTRRHARKAYDAILHFLQTARLSVSERDNIDQKLQELREVLRDLGEELVPPSEVSARRGGSRATGFPNC